MDETNLVIALTDRASGSFAQLLDWHLKWGTRPDGTPKRRGRRWTNPKFDRAVSGRSDREGRTVRYWLDGTLPDDPQSIARELFGAKPADNPAYDEWREEFWAVYDRECQKKPTSKKSQPEQTATASQIISENFVLDPTPETLPCGLRAPRPVLYRDEVVENLKATFGEWRQAGCLITLAGPPDAGKSSIFQQFAATLSDERERDPPIALLYVDLSSSQRPLKAFDLALRPSTNLPTAPNLGAIVPEDGEGEDEDQPQRQQLEFVRDRVAGRLGGRVLVAFLERYSDVAGDEACMREMQRIMALPTFRRAFNLLESQGEPLPGYTSSAAAVVPLKPFPPPKAADFLIQNGLREDWANDAIDLLTGHEEVFHPGILLKGAFPYLPNLVEMRGGNPTADEVAIAIMEHASNIAHRVVATLCAPGDYDPNTAMVSLMALSLFSEATISPELLTNAGLTPFPAQRLTQLGWLEGAGGGKLSGFGRGAFRTAAALTLSGDAASGDELRNAIRGLTTELSGQEWARVSPALNGAVAWLRIHARRETELLTELQILLAQVTAADAVSSFTEEQERRIAPEFFRRGAEKHDFDAALAALVLYARGLSGELQSDTAGANFLNSLQRVMQFIETGLQLNARQLFALDNAIFHGSRLFHLYREALSARKTICDTLLKLEAEALKRGDQPWLSGWMSFLMNAADLGLSCGEQDAAIDFASLTRRIEANTPWLKNDSWKHWRLARLALLHARLAGTATAEKSALTDAVGHATECFRLTRDDPRCIRFYLRTVRRLVKAEGDDRARKRQVDDAITQLEEVLGPPADWDTSVRSQAAALMREEAGWAWESDYQRNRNQQALQLLRTTRSRGSDELETDPRALLVQARIQAALGERKAALDSCEKALRLEPSPSAWRLKLRLLDAFSNDQGIELASVAPISPEFRKAIREFRSTVSEYNLQHPSYGNIELQLTEREYRAEGSLERHVAVQLLRNQQTEYSGLTSDEKLNRLSAVFRRRENQLRGFGKRFGPSPALTLAEFRNARQYVRSSAVLTGGPPDTHAVLTVLDDGLKRWPGNHMLLFERADYLRYVWDLEEALEGFRKAQITSTDRDLRQRAAICLVRTLHAAIVHREDAGLFQRAEWVNEAKQTLDRLSENVRYAQEAAVLRDHVALEAGDSVDWSSLEDVYDRIVGTIGGFPTTLLANYDHISDDAGRPIDVAQALKSSFADPEILGFAGSLYLARAEKNLGNQRQQDFARAVAFFRAEALLERSWTGREYPATSFRIGRAIVLSAEAFRTADPIVTLDTDGKPDQLALAEAKFNSVGSRSTGRFRDMARLWQGRAAQLRADLAR